MTDEDRKPKHRNTPRSASVMISSFCDVVATMYHSTIFLNKKVVCSWQIANTLRVLGFVPQPNVRGIKNKRLHGFIYTLHSASSMWATATHLDYPLNHLLF